MFSRLCYVIAKTVAVPELVEVRACVPRGAPLHSFGIAGGGSDAEQE
jgi:hypothetical protein